MTSQPQYLGVTPPITLSGPSPREEAVTKLLLEELKRQNTYETEEGEKTREIVLGRIAALVKAFVYKVSKLRGLSDAAAAASGGKIFTFGSYRLGVHPPGADIDTLLVVPKHVSRDDFFTTFLPMLQEFEGTTEVTGVPEAYVPIIKTKISGVEIDFLCARLALAQIPDDLELRDDSLLKNLDERCVRSLGGSRVTDEILRLVPNVPVFRDALRCIKLWAQRRAIYSNVMGFLGGVAWAMLVARICQLYPNQAAGAIVSKFFTIMHQWKWPQPVLLKNIEDGPLNVRVWNPKLYPADRLHRMPIITPAYPAMCSTHNVTASTQDIMTNECRRAAEVVDRVMKDGAPWSELFEKHDFFSRYRYYIQVVASANSSENLKKWSGTVESKIRQLVMKLEHVDSMKLAHPFTKPFEHVNHCINDDEMRAVVLSTIPDAVLNRKIEDVEDQSTIRDIYTSTFFIGLGIVPKEPGSTAPRKLDITYPTTEFKKMATMWELFDLSKMDLHITHIKSAQLPNWVFDGGVRPTPKAVKRAKPSKTSPNSRASDLPNKKRRSSLTQSSNVTAGHQSQPAIPAPNGTAPVPQQLIDTSNLSNMQVGGNIQQPVSQLIKS
ncbi:polynucleotide adenylyltransferase [Tulasnella sp. 419]|nr:polynucleotide adenylyltransferase [Tulasnella sp. 418]KAG8965759.1 polynucleotide adenylyltransferase [Tulasnella sp. 419]